MGHIAHPSLLLLLLRLKRLSALDQHQQPFIRPRQNERLERFSQLLPFRALGTLLMTRADDRFLELRNRQHLLQRHAAHEQVAGDMQQPFCAGVDVSDGQIRRQDQPSLGGGIDPGKQLGSVDGSGRKSRTVFVLPPPRPGTDPTLQNKGQCRSGDEREDGRNLHGVSAEAVSETPHRANQLRG